MPLEQGLGRLLARQQRKSKRPEWLDDVDARDMLEELGVEKIFDAGIDELNYSCPFDGHDHGDSRPSAYMNTGTLNKNMNTLFKCHGCGRGGNAISFVSEFQNVTRGRASQWLRERFAPG